MSTPKKTAVAVAMAFSAPAVLAQSVATAPQPAELPPVIVTANPLGSGLFDLVPPVSVLGGRELSLRRESTLGETLNGLPGVSSSYFGPNAGRPVIRGLDADRVRLMQNGLGMLDVSALSPDHAVPLDPLAIEQVEVVRGPAALLYGGSAVGGVVNALDNRIPQEPIKGSSGRAETRFGGPENQRSGSAVVEGGNGVLAVHADVFQRTSDDLEIPDFARSSRLRAQSPLADEPRGRLRNSSASADGGALGASLTFDRGYAGLAYSSYNSEYGTVAEEDVRIDMKSKRWDFAGEIRDLGTVITRVKVRLGYTDYEHQELEAGQVATTFLNKGREGTVEAAHGKIGPLAGVFGVQIHSVDFSALGEEAFLPRTRTDTKAAYLYEELPFEKLKLTLGGRIERADVESSGGGPDDPNNPGAPRFGSPQIRSFTPRSLAAGSLYSFSKEVALAVNLSHSERAPTYNELFANGPHTATGQFEVGSSKLSEEKSNGADVQLRWRAGQHSASVGGFYTRFSNYIAVFNSGNTRATDGTLNPIDADGDGIADTSGLSILPEALMRAVPAQFYGLEAEGKFRVYDRTGSLDLTLRGDYVRASNRETGEPLPRIAPLRLGLGLDYRFGNFGSRLDVTHAARQNRVASAELPTDSYTLVNAWLTYRIKAEAFNLEAFLKANNLFNQEARVHTSVLKDIAPLAGRGLMVGLRGSF
ncbi:MAG: iron complex outermembrane recepter protein [Rhodocyclaceae bacterium]|nr:MAG: iron complex outermembrane recepter protein [Rhodocyclaceae bacterium]